MYGDPSHQINGCQGSGSKFVKHSDLKVQNLVATLNGHRQQVLLNLPGLDVSVIGIDPKTVGNQDYVPCFQASQLSWRTRGHESNRKALS